MGTATPIGYVDSSSNPVWGCDGCELLMIKRGIEKCYAHRMTPNGFLSPTLDTSKLVQTFKWKDLTGTERNKKPWLNYRPRFIFLNDMGDSWAKGVPSDWLKPYLENIKASPHIYLIFTKRVSKAYKFFKSVGWIPRNVYLFTSITSEKTMGRLDYLLKLKEIDKGCKLGVSFEPLWSKVELAKRLNEKKQSIDWVVAGGESGPTAPPSHPEWFESLRDDCKKLNIPFFFKQWGEWSPYPLNDKVEKKQINNGSGFSDVFMYKNGKHNNEAKLAGVYERGVPEKPVYQIKMF